MTGVNHTYILTRDNLHPDTIKDFEIENNLYDHSWSFRDLPCRTVIGVKIHHTKTHDKNDKTTQHS